MALCQVADRAGPRAVILDLSHPKLDLGGMVAQLRHAAPGMKVVAFGPHVHEDLLAEAGRAGCDAVIARGTFLSTVGFVTADRGGGALRLVRVTARPSVGVIVPG